MRTTRMHGYITQESVTGKRGTIPQLLSGLSQLDLGTVLPLVAMLNNAFVRSQGQPDPEGQRKLVGIFFDEEWQQRILDTPSMANPYTSTVFHQQQQLMMLRLALIACEMNESSLFSLDAVHRFGPLCLTASDILRPTESEREKLKQPLGRITTLLPLAELQSDMNPLRLIARAQHLWLKLPETGKLEAESDYLNFDLHFQEHYGISINDFMNVVNLIHAQCLAYDPSREDCFKWLVIDTSVAFKNTSIKSGAVERVFGLISSSVDDLGQRLVNEPCQSMRSDFTLFRRFPLLKLKNHTYLCVDRGFLLKLLTDGLYWLIRDALEGRQRNKFQSFFGKVYAGYLTAILKRIYPSPVGRTLLAQRLHIGPKFEGIQDEVCDALIDCGDAVILMEFKGSLLTSHAKYSGDTESLAREITGKFIRTPKGSKGVAQLARSIERVLSGKRIGIPNLDTSRFNTFIPVIVSYDSAVTDATIPEYLDDHFKGQLGLPGDSSRRVLPVTVLSSLEIEVLEGLCVRYPLHEVIQRFHRQPNSGEPLSFWHFLTSNYGQMLTPDGTLVGETFKAIHERMLGLFEARAGELPTTSEGG